MADMILGPAQGAVDSLLGRLTSALAEEARLLGGVRGDVQFIKDEMESMNGFLLRMVDATNGGDCEDEDPQVRAWMKQVAEVAYASQNCVNLYVRSVGNNAREQGLLGFLRQLPQLLWTLPARHRIATQIRELKTRALEVGERRMRYGVEAPPRSKLIDTASLHNADGDNEHLKLKEHEDARRRALAEDEPVAFESLSLIRWMTEKEGSGSGSGSGSDSGVDPLHLPFDGSENTENLGGNPLLPPGNTREKTKNSGDETAKTQSSGERSEKTEHQTQDSGISLMTKLLREVQNFPLDPTVHVTGDTSHGDDGDEIEEIQSSDRRKQTDIDNEENYGAQVNSTLRVLALVTSYGCADFAKKAFEDPWVASSCSLDYKAWIQLGPEYPPRSPSRLLWDILAKLVTPVEQSDGADECSYEELVEKLKLHLEGKNFLIVLENVTNTSIWDAIKPAFLDGSCSPGSALLITADSHEMAHAFSPYKVYELGNLLSDHRDYLTNFYLNQAVALVSNNPQIKHLKPVMRNIIRALAFRADYCKFFLHVLYANPNQTIGNFRALLDSLDMSSWSKNKKHLLVFAYNGLSSNCKNCLLYLSIFPEDTTFRRTRLVRRWAVESMIPKRGRLIAQDEADHCLDVLVAHRFVKPVDTIFPSMVKRFAMDRLTHRLVTKIASNENFFNINLLPVWAHRVPIRNTTQQQQASQQLQSTYSKACCYIFSPSLDEAIATKQFLESLPLSTMFPPLEMLDLEDCKELQDRHLKSICNHVLKLKYLSLRNTDITKLPKQLNKLRYLETLDIRQTKVRSFSRNSLVLPKLKHLLAGLQTSHRRSQQDTFLWNEPIVTAQMPKNIWTMLELQVLYHVAVSRRGDELIGIGNLLQLRKLGLVLNECEEQIFRHLYRAIEKLSKCLRSLSIRSISDNKNAKVDNGYITQRLYIIPMHLRTLKFSGLEGLPRWIRNLNQLHKITLNETLLTADDIQILGELTRLCCLRLGEMSCSESTLIFSTNSFQSLKLLIIKCSNINNIYFSSKATTNVVNIVWSSTGFQSLSLSGIMHLKSLKELSLKGNFDIDKVNKEIAANQNNPRLDWKQTRMMLWMKICILCTLVTTTKQH